MLPDYMFLCSDGALYDTRKPDWSSNPLRPIYQRHAPIIRSLNEVKAALRAGNHTDLGGYPLYFVTSDGGVLSFEAAESEYKQVVWDYLHDASTGWRIVACEINYEDDSLYCDHTGKQIPSAYGDD